MTLDIIGGREISRVARKRKGGMTPRHIFYVDDGLVASTEPE